MTHVPSLKPARKKERAREERVTVFRSVNGGAHDTDGGSKQCGTQGVNRARRIQRIEFSQVRLDQADKGACKQAGKLGGKRSGGMVTIHAKLAVGVDTN